VLEPNRSSGLPYIMTNKSSMKLNPNARWVFCNRTLNLNAIRAIGYDMDYTLVHYLMNRWEQRAYSYIKEGIRQTGWNLEDLEFDPKLAVRGLVIDTQLGNVVKANRFGYIKRAFHGTKPLEFEQLRRNYQRTLVDLAEKPRWYFLNTLFSISAACMFMQLVELHDLGALPGCISYEEIFRRVVHASDEAHMEGRLKSEILSAPAKFVELDKETPLALLDQKESGKKLLLITNSEWSYVDAIMTWAFDPFLPDSLKWRDLFDIIIVRARKPDFFTLRMPVFEVVNAEGLLRECRGPLSPGRIYLGANARLVEDSLELSGEELMYVGDHIFTDVTISKNISRWRTALVIRELEDEIAAAEAFMPEQAELSRLMAEKESMESQYCSLRLAGQRIRHGRKPPWNVTTTEIQLQMAELHDRIVEIDSRIAPLAKASAQLLNKNWGLLMRTGIDKSHLARQIERYADIYTARVSNFLHVTPSAFLRSSWGGLPHDPQKTG